MDKILSYTLREEDLGETAGGLVNLVLKNRIGVTGHEISRAKFTPSGITADGVQVTVKDRIRPGQTLRVVLPENGAGEKGEERVPPTPAPPGMLRFLYEDADLVVLNKPPGTVVHPTHGHWHDTLGNYLASYYQGCPGAVICHVTGRLDMDTSGALVYAKNCAAAGRLNRERQEGVFQRTYLALVHGVFPEGQKCGTVDAPIGREPGVLMKRRVAPPGEGDRAVTHYRVLRDTAGYQAEDALCSEAGAGRTKDGSECLAGAEGASLVECRIDTGRTHQIRVHMAYLGHPLYRDPLYGLPEERESGRAMLHAARVAFLQPFTGSRIAVTAPEAADFAALRKRLGL